MKELKKKSEMNDKRSEWIGKSLGILKVEDFLKSVKKIGKMNRQSKKEEKKT